MAEFHHFTAIILQRAITARGHCVVLRGDCSEREGYSGVSDGGRASRCVDADVREEPAAVAVLARR